MRSTNVDLRLTLVCQVSDDVTFSCKIWEGARYVC